jgi:hypothetical protein
VSDDLEKYSASINGSEMPWCVIVTVVTDDFHDGSVIVMVCFWGPQSGGKILRRFC